MTRTRRPPLHFPALRNGPLIGSIGSRPVSRHSVLATVGGGALGAPLTAPHTAEYPDMDALPIGWVSSPLPDATYCPAALQRAAGLVWRAVVLWMVLLLMLTCAVWLGEPFCMTARESGLVVAAPGRHYF